MSADKCEVVIAMTSPVSVCVDTHTRLQLTQSKQKLKLVWKLRVYNDELMQVAMQTCKAHPAVLLYRQKPKTGKSREIKVSKLC